MFTKNRKVILGPDLFFRKSSTFSALFQYMNYGNVERIIFQYKVEIIQFSQAS